MIDYEPVKRTKDLIKIKVIGVGGGGNNAVNQMIVSDVDGVEYILVNTEKGILERANTNGCKTLQIGKEVAQGLGAGANPEVGEKAARESIDDIDKILDGTDLLFVTAGMGGGTGTGAIPVIAEEAKKKGIMTIGIVTKPFAFEGKLRSVRANLGIDKLKPNVNALIVISNDKLLQNTETNVSILNAFKMTDDILRQGIQSITDIINSVGTINVDFADVRSVMESSGSALMGIGRGTGEGRALEAAKSAINSPLLETSINGASGIIMNVTGGPDMTLYEVTDAAQVIHDAVSEDATVHFGAVIDDRIQGEIQITVIATGFELKKNQVDKFAQEQEEKTLGAMDLFGSNSSSPKISKAASDFANNILDIPEFLKK